MKTSILNESAAVTLQEPARAEEADSSPVAEFQNESVDLFVRLADLIGVPRSVGELYGLLYASPDPVTMDVLSERLHLSKGATSQGLKLLRTVGAVRVMYVPGDRRDHFVAETELRKLLDGFLREQIQPHLESGGQRLERMRDIVRDIPGDHRSWCEDRIERLERWQKRASQLVPLVARITRI
ncbi:MAG: hypothetical protein KBA51_03570 [Kiritimatiellae bacterium]|nr:hypothetical protein [Kiritimatiellia bacterium]